MAGEGGGAVKLNPLELALAASPFDGSEFDEVEGVAPNLNADDDTSSEPCRGRASVAEGVGILLSSVLRRRVSGM